jgi:hypothetical protein
MTRAVAWSACGVVVALAAGRFGLAIADPQSAAPTTDPRVPGGGLGAAGFEAVVLVALGVVGAIVASRRPRNPVGWIMCVIPVSFGLLIVGRRLFWSFELDDSGSAAAEAMAWVSAWVWVPAMFAALVFFPLLFPTGAPPTPRWRAVKRVGTAGAVAVMLGFAFSPGRLEDFPLSNPLGLDGAAGSTAQVLLGLGFVLMVGSTLAAIASAVVRFRRSEGVERQQLKWVTAAAALLIVCVVFPFGGTELGYATLMFGFLVIAVAVAVAMLRYRLYDIDVVINRTLVYGGLTATLAAAYLGSVLLLQLVLSGVTEGSGLAVAVSTLSVAALFRPARSRIQAAVDRRFYRRKYDAEQTLAAFSGRLRAELDLDALHVALRGVVTQTMQPTHVSLWLREPGPRR